MKRVVIKPAWTVGAGVESLFTLVQKASKCSIPVVESRNKGQRLPGLAQNQRQVLRPNLVPKNEECEICSSPLVEMAAKVS